MPIDSVEKARLELETDYAVHLELSIIVHKNGEWVDVVDLLTREEAMQAIELVYSEKNHQQARAKLQNESLN